MFKYKSHDQNTKLRKFKMADGRHLKKKFFSLCLGPESSDFNEIWWGDANFVSNNSHVAKYQNFAHQLWRLAAIL